MLKITVIAVDKLKKEHWSSAQAEFLKRMTPFSRLDIIEVKASPITATVTAEMSMREEAGRILPRVPEGGAVVALTPSGKGADSIRFAKQVERWASGTGRITFIIGGAAGLDRAVLDRADHRFSLSPMTFPHEMARVMLLEQLYRAMTILGGKTYHY